MLKKDEDVVYTYATRETYVKKIIKFGGTPIFVPPIYQEDLLDYYYSKSNGILLQGGSDINPEMYNETIQEFTKPKELDRDKVELYLVQRAITDKKPVLGICRGCQMLGIASGGKLVQDIPSIQNTLKHTVSDERGYNELFDADNKHEVYIQKDSRIYDMLGVEKIFLNTAHHQFVKSVGPNFRIVGKTIDGVTEIIEHVDKNYFCFGFQSHIEAMDNEILDTIFLKFIECM